MRPATTNLLRRIAIVSLACLGIVLVLIGLLLLLSAGLAMGPEDEVPFAMWSIPLGAGAIMFLASVLLTRRAPHKAPPGGW